MTINFRARVLIGNSYDCLRYYSDFVQQINLNGFMFFDCFLLTNKILRPSKVFHILHTLSC